MITRYSLGPGVMYILQLFMDWRNQIVCLKLLEHCFQFVQLDSGSLSKFIFVLPVSALNQWFVNVFKSCELLFKGFLTPCNDKLFYLSILKTIPLIRLSQLWVHVSLWCYKSIEQQKPMLTFEPEQLRSVLESSTLYGSVLNMFKTDLKQQWIDIYFVKIVQKSVSYCLF